MIHNIDLHIRDEGTGVLRFNQLREPLVENIHKWVYGLKNRFVYKGEEKEIMVDYKCSICDLKFSLERDMQDTPYCPCCGQDYDVSKDTNEIEIAPTRDE